MKHKQLDYDSRLTIQYGLSNYQNFSQIAQTLGKSRSSIMREVKAHRIPVRTSTRNNCLFRLECTRNPSCKKNCFRKKANCQSSCSGCNTVCPDYKEEICPNHSFPPYVCNSCVQKVHCRFTKMMYDARIAQRDCDHLRSEARRGISLSEKELQDLDELVSDGINRGLSIPVICSEYRDKIPVSAKTVYSYIDAGLLQAKNIDLRRKVSRPTREKSGPVLRVDRKCHIGRTYEDFEVFVAGNPDLAICQMDSVILKKGKQTLLTILFTNCDLQLMFLREKNTASSVTETFQFLRETLGAVYFRQLFQIILTDRGSEFSDPSPIEGTIDNGDKECHVFYCDPRNSNQKSNCERNHELIRYIIPKKNKRDDYTQNDVLMMMNHINSYPRKKWNGQAPIDLFEKIYGTEVSNLLGLQKIPSASINLTPALLKK